LASQGKGFFARLFGRRRRKNDFEPTLAHALGATVKGGLARALDGEVPVEADPLAIEEVIEQVRLRSPGWLAFFSADSDAAELTLLIPDSWSAGVSPAQTGQPEKGVPAVVTTVCVHAADFLRFDAPAVFHRYFRRYGPGDLPLLEWRLSGTRTFRLVTGDADGPSLYAGVREETALAFEESLRDDRRRQEALRAYLDWRAEPAVEEAPPVPASPILALRAPREFVLGALFLPPRVECGTQVAEVMCTALATTPEGSLADAAGVWAAASAEAAAPGGRTRLSVWYFFPAADPARALKARDTFRGLAGCLFRGALSPLSEALGARLENPGLAMDARPDMGRSGLLCIQARVRLGGAHVRVEACVESTILAALLRRHCNPAALAATTGAARSALPAAMGLNDELLGKSLQSFPRAFLDARMGTDFFPFSAFADLVTDRDLALVAQNHLPRALAGQPLRRLVAWSQPAPADGARRTVTPLFFDEERILRLLPPQGRETWERTAAEELGSREDYFELNRAVLAGIARAAQKGVLLLSPRARGILSRMALPGIQQRARQKLQEAVSSGVPFAALRKMSKPLVQRLFATQPDRAICLALAGSESELAFVRANVSAARRARLEEDLAHVRTQLSEGSIDPDEAMRARRSIEEAALRMREESQWKMRTFRGRGDMASHELNGYTGRRRVRRSD
jgi:hypothetical protein